MKRLVTCLILDIIILLEMLKYLIGRMYSVAVMKDEMARSSSSTMGSLIYQQQKQMIMDGIGVIAAVVMLIVLITLIASEKKREENRPIVMNYNVPAGDVQNIYITPEYSGGSDHRVDPQNYGGNMNG